MNQKYFLIAFLFFFTVFSTGISAQPQISGVINTYSKVDSVFPTRDTLIVADIAQFSEDDTVMIYQAKGSVPNLDTSKNYELIGSVRSNATLKSAGRYEIIIIDTVILSENRVILRTSLTNHYDPGGLVQLIHIPSYKNVRVSGILTCDPWDGEKGGVLVFFANDTIYLEANIDVSGKGFRGAEPVLNDHGTCSEFDTTYFHQYLFHELSDSVGRKGEGIVKYDSAYAKGLSRWGNGGGGGNARFAGGGGGSNKATGGQGGTEDTISCNVTKKKLGGRGGQTLQIGPNFNDSIIFFGGGGGTGTYTNELYASAGGNGGGIVIILGKFMVGNNYQILADGESVTDTATASGGGGGGGGTIIFDVDSVQGDLGISFIGGKGGDTKGVFLSGPGGGGSGGSLTTIKVLTSDYVDGGKAGGSAGTVTNLGENFLHEATDGNFGLIVDSIDVHLSGFLFNSIRENHTICSGDTPHLILGSNPRGGDSIYSYTWEKSQDGSDWTMIDDSSRKNLQPGPITETTYYRRIVQSAGIIDNGLPIKVFVQKSIMGNQIFPDDTITCIGNVADTINGATVQIGGDGSYSYLWQSSFDMGNWDAIDLLNDTVCLPGEVLDTTFIRRVVTSGVCYDTSRIVEIIGLPQIEKNNISESQEICFGQIPEEIIGEQPINGLGPGNYEISWQESIDGLNWDNIADSSRLNLAPSNLVETTYYRRIVESDDCFDVSDSVKINVLPLIENNTITNSANIFTCYGTEPELLNGSDPLGGDNEYHYQWIESSDNFSWLEIAENANNKDYQPPELTVQNFYRRIVRSGQDSCCLDTSNMITVNIHPLPIADIDNFEDTICSAENITLNFSISSGQQPYSLTFSDGESLTTITNISATERSYDVNPATSLGSKIYNYTIDSVSDANGCLATNLSGETEIVVYGWPETDAGTDTEECILTHQMDAGISLGEGIWSQIGGPGNTSFNNTTQATTEISVDSAGLYEYQWKELNWKCADSDSVSLTFYESPYNIYAGPDTILYKPLEYTLEGSYNNPDHVVELISEWEIVMGSASLENKNDLVAKVIDFPLDVNESEIIVLWKIEKGVCDIPPDSLIITLRPIFTPTGFTPNNDIENQYLRFPGVENYENELFIYNRWGTEVFSKENFSNDPGWDGKNKRGYPLPDDTYYYILKIRERSNNSIRVFKGFIVIKRN